MPSSIEKRVAALEIELARLKMRIGNQGGKSWIEQIAGTFADDPAAYKEATRLGREYRESLDKKPKPRKGKRSNGRARH